MRLLSKARHSCSDKRQSRRRPVTAAIGGWNSSHSRARCQAISLSAGFMNDDTGRGGTAAGAGRRVEGAPRQSAAPERQGSSALLRSARTVSPCDRAEQDLPAVSINPQPTRGPRAALPRVECPAAAARGCPGLCSFLGPELGKRK